MTIGILQIQGLLIQAVGLVYQAASASPVVSATLEAAGSGGLLQSLVPSHGVVHWTATTTMSSEATAFEAAAPQFVASGIKNFKL